MSDTEKETSNIPVDISNQWNILRTRLERYWRRIQLCYDLIRQLPTSKITFRARSNNIQATYDSILNLVDELSEIECIYTDLESNCSNISEQVDNMYFAILEKLEELWPSSNDEGNSSDNKLSKVSLPKITIPTFSGELSEFPGFIALYDTLIHNSSQLSDIEKFSYLISSLKDSAAKVVQTIPFAPDNYIVAYNLLKERYTNERLMVSFYLDNIFSMKPLTENASHKLNDFLETLQTNYSCLKTLKIPDLGDFMLLFWSLKLLDSDTRTQFEQHTLEVNGPTKTPTFCEFVDFLKNKITVNKLAGVNNKSISHLFKNKSLSKNENKKAFVATPQPMKTCKICKKEHALHKCPEFLNKSPQERIDIVKQIKVCFGCLNDHFLSNCVSQGVCKFCKQKHHYLLHKQNIPSINQEQHNDQALSPNSEQSSSAKPSLSALSRPSPPSLLGTAQVYVRCGDGSWKLARALVDCGSTVNFVTSSLASKLRLQRRRCPFEVSGVGESSHVTQKGIISTSIRPRLSNESTFALDLIVVPKITSLLPTSKVTHLVDSSLMKLDLADPSFHIPGKIDLLLGVQLYMEILRRDCVPIFGKPSAVPTQLGWVIMGEVPNHASESYPVFFSTVNQEVSDLETTLKRFWEREEVNLDIPVSPEDQYCEDFFTNTVSRDASGRYQVRLPFKGGKPPTFVSTYNKAHKRLCVLENKFSKDSEYELLYRENLNDYIQQQHMTLALRQSPYVMPHHGVIKNDSSPRKIRVVFSPNEKDANGLSLNDSLLAGPKLQRDVGQVVTNFRVHKIALVCDIKQMYREIKLHPDDAFFQHILWRDNRLESPKEYEITRVCFGVTSSPYLAQRTLQQLVKDEGDKYPLAASVITDSSFVDDLLGGASSLAEVYQLKHELISLLRCGGFELGKWASSRSEVIASDNLDMVDISSSCILGDVKVLGLWWDSNKDIIKFKVDSSEGGNTKRCLLSKIARIYDYNGYLAPFTFYLKCLLQEVWLSGCDWDSPVPCDIWSRWSRAIAELSLLESIEIPRWISSDVVRSLDIVGFCDASSLGMAAVIYLRVETDCDVFLHLLKAKTRVAPLKTWTIPRLELGSALLLSKSVQSLLPISHLNISSILLLSDSITALSWIHTAPYKLKIFESNRVIQITDSCPNAQWFHIPGKLNPADFASRGLTPSQLCTESSWWSGPTFAKLPFEQWPVTQYTVKDEPNFQCASFHIAPYGENSFAQLVDRCSSFLKVQRITAYVIRFVYNLKVSVLNKHEMRIKGPIQVSDYKESLNLLISSVQSDHFRDDLKALRSNRPCSGGLRSLDPFICHQGLLRVGGRLNHSLLPYSAKNPILIPRKSSLAVLICDYFHQISGHGGPRIMQALIRREYWVPSLRQLVRHRIFKCLTCYKQKAQPISPKMADLPSYRIQPSRVFSHTGVDLAGPFVVKPGFVRSTKTVKAYLALFVCMATKAIHLEPVSDLSTQAFLACLDRFIGRRGLPGHIYSDQGKNFQGASRDLSEIEDFLKTSHDDVASFLATRHISWHFNPPYSPDFGGLWEAGIKSVKSHFKRVVGNSLLTWEEFTTVLIKIEAIVNSRPLCALSDSLSDGSEYLSPGHFLIGAPLLDRPRPDLLDLHENKLDRWESVQRMTQSFWRMWSQDYLNTLTQRCKWRGNTADLKVGDIVLYFRPGLVPAQWPLGRISKVLPGKDGIVRVVNVRCSNGDEILRSARKIIPLPIQ